MYQQVEVIHVRTNTDRISGLFTLLSQKGACNVFRDVLQRMLKQLEMLIILKGAENVVYIAPGMQVSGLCRCRMYSYTSLPLLVAFDW